MFPIGKSVSINGKTQVDANAFYHGGVATDIKIPMDAAMAIDIFTNGKDRAFTFAENCLRNSC